MDDLVDECLLRLLARLGDGDIRFKGEAEGKESIHAKPRVAGGDGGLRIETQALHAANAALCDFGDECLARIGDVAIAYAERTGKISPEDAALAREAGRLLLTPAPAETATK